VAVVSHGCYALVLESPERCATRESPERVILDVLVDHWPAAVPVETIAAAIGYSLTSGGFRNALSRIRIRIRIRIRTLHIAAGRGELLLNDTLIDPPEAPDLTTCRLRASTMRMRRRRTPPARVRTAR